MQEDPRKISISDYTYELPNERIAQYPLKERDTSKLLIYRREEIQEDKFLNIDGYLREGSLLVFNDTRVVQARLLFPTETEKFIEIFCLEPEDTADYTEAFAMKGECRWKCMIGNLKKWKEGTVEKEFQVYSQICRLKSEKITTHGESFTVKFSWEPGDITFGEILDAAGLIPLPPYIKRPADEADKLTYQTLYSKHKGSVAAPTAGLHFTESVLEKLANKNIECRHVTLHVGAGTFKPVKAEHIGGHEMHRELISVSRSLIEELLNRSRDVICVGTTSLRTVESLYWIGAKLKREPGSRNINVTQWEPYDTQPDITTKEALEEILRYMENEGLQVLTGYTEIIILPGYEFKIADGLITNFHQPQSTLLLLIAAFAGDKWRDMYEHAVNNGFRFLSYGDSSLILRK